MCGLDLPDGCKKEVGKCCMECDEYAGCRLACEGFLEKGRPVEDCEYWEDVE